jgi:molybdate transport system permease protein
MHPVELYPLFLSFKVAAFATVLSAIGGIGIGALLSNRRFVGRNVLDVLITAPMVLPPTVLGYYVLIVLGRRSVLGALFERVTGSTIVFTQTGAVVAASIGALPIVVKSARAALESVDPVVVNAARTLGANPARAFLTVQIPLAAPGIVSGTMLGFARALGDFGVTLMVAGDIPGETQTASLAIYDAIQSNQEGRAVLMIAILTVVALAVLYFTNKLSKAPHAE